ncbi:unannotated protein [freshwater metagenome]|uniref:Unannotated protein n=1 Tax=freshwater metagenome TaxID=449393 RepID=A0A6J7A6F9_9ZZZZ
MIGGDSKARYEHGSVSELVSALSGNEQHGCGTIGLGAAIEQPERGADFWSSQNLINSDFVLEVSEGVECAVVVIFDCNRCQHLFCGAVLVHVTRGERGKEHGCRFASCVDRVSTCSSR